MWSWGEAVWLTRLSERAGIGHEIALPFRVAPYSLVIIRLQHSKSGLIWRRTWYGPLLPKLKASWWRRCLECLHFMELKVQVSSTLTSITMFVAFAFGSWGDIGLTSLAIGHWETVLAPSLTKYLDLVAELNTFEYLLKMLYHRMALHKSNRDLCVLTM